MVSNFVSIFLSGSNYIYNSDENIDSLTNMVSTVMNELLENSVKFAYHDSSLIEIQIGSLNETIFMQVTNCIDHDQYKRFTSYLDYFFNEESLEDKYLKRMHDIEKQNAINSEIGLLLILHSFPISISYHFSEEDNHITVIATCLLDKNQVIT